MDPNAEKNADEKTPETASAGTASAESDSAQKAPDAVTELTTRLAEALANSEKHKDEWLRARAETDNIRRRAAEDVLKAQKFGVERIADALLAVKDSLDAALVVESPSVDSYRQGVELTARQLSSVFEKFSITELNPAGAKFDPTRHQAISAVESDAEPNTVLSVMQKGYALHDRILRPALVAVAKARG